MLKLSSRQVGATFYGILAGAGAGLCFGLRAWWPAGILTAAAVQCLLWSARGAILIDQVLEIHGIPATGEYDTKEIMSNIEARQRRLEKQHRIQIKGPRRASRSLGRNKDVN